MKRYLKAVAVAAAIVAVVPSMASAQTKHYKLDAYDAHPAKPGVAGPAVSDAPLTDGVFYIAEVEGTVSFYVKRMWTNPFSPWDDICGETRSRPKYFSPDVDEDKQGQVGADAETVFARPCDGPGSAAAPAIGHWGNFEINVGDGLGYRHIDPTDGRHTSPSWSSAYDYALTGHGLPVKFHLLDLAGKTRDNYGQLDINIRVATPNDCGFGGDLYRYRGWGFDSYEACFEHMRGGAQDADTYMSAIAAQQVAANGRKAAAKRSSARS